MTILGQIYKSNWWSILTFSTALFSTSKSFLLLAWVIKIILSLPGTSLLPSLNLYFYTFPLHCVSSQIKDLSLLFPLSSLSLTAFTRRESTFSINTCNYIWQLPNLNWFNFTTRIYKNKKHSSHSPVSFRMRSLLRFPLFFRAYQEISAYKVVIYMKSSGNSQTQLFENILLSHGVKSELPWKSGLV